MSPTPLLAALAAAALAAPAAAEPFFTESELGSAFRSQTFDAEKRAMCQPVPLMRRQFPGGVPCTQRGDFTVEDLAAAASAVFGEASMDEDEQCAVAAVIFNRLDSDHRTLRSVVSAPGQFHGYRGVRNRMECEKLEASVRAVARFAVSGRCSFGAPRFRYFCSEAGFQRVRGRHEGDPEQGRLIGMSRFRVRSACGDNSAR